MKHLPWMGAFLRMILMTGAAVSTISCSTIPAELSGNPLTLIRNVTVIPMERPGSVAGQDVVVAAGRVVALRRAGMVRPRAGDRVIDGTGKYLMPGLWDMHTHALLEGAAPARDALSLYLANGVVGVRDLGSTLEELAAAKQELPLGTELPHLLAGGPLLDGPKQPWQQKMALALNTVGEARAAAEKLAANGVDFLKIYNNLSEEQFAAVAEVAKRHGLPIAGHVPFKVSLETVSAAGQKSIEHAGMQLGKDCIPDGMKATPAVLSAWISRGYPGKYEETSRWWAKRDQPRCNALYVRMAERGTWVTPTLTNEVQGGMWASAHDLSLLPPDRLQACQSNLQSANSRPQLRDAADRDLFKLVLDLHRAGVPILAGTDTPNSCLAYGSSLHKELQMLRHAGLSPWEVLKTATLNAARFFGRADEGVVRQGAVANLLLLDADPLTDVANTRRIAGVMVGGRWNDARALQKLREQVEPTTIYDNAVVWNGNGFEARRLAVRHGRFVDADAVRGATRIDLDRGFVVPAFGNAHAHVTSPTAAGSWNYLKEGVFYVWNPNTVVMNQAAQDFFARKDTVDVVAAQGGITEPGGHPEKLYVDILGKYVYKGMSLKDFLGNAFHYGRNTAEIDAALELLQKQKAAFVKTYLLYSEEYTKRRTDPAFYGARGVNPVHMPYLVAAARKRGLGVAVHVETAHDLRIAALSGAAVAAHLPGYWSVTSRDDLERRVLTPADAALVARSGMLLVPTYAVANRPEMSPAATAKAEVSREQVHRMQVQNIRSLKAAGARFLIGTDGPGPIYDEVEHLAATGAFTAREALSVALVTGRNLYPTRRIGCFEPGCEADFLVLSADPSRDLSNLRKVAHRVKAGVLLKAPEPLRAD